MNFHISGEGAPLGTRSSITDRVAELFHEEIRTGRWNVGSQIPVEAELVRWTGAGRNTVREAVQSLAQAGLVRREQGRGTFVIARSQLTQSLHRRVAASSRKDALELRQAIDSAAAEWAAIRRTADDVATLRELLEARSQSWNMPSIDERMRADTALHTGIVAATHNELIIELYDGLLDVFVSALRADVQGDADPHEIHHRDLVQAIIDRDPDRARHQINLLLTPLIESAALEWPADTSGLPPR